MILAWHRGAFCQFPFQFTTMAVIKQPKRKLAKRTSVHGFEKKQFSMRYPVQRKTERMLSHQFKLDKTYQQLYSLSRTHFAHWGHLILYPRNIQFTWLES